MIPPFATKVLPPESSDEERVRAYHERSKHRPGGFAPGPETLDWEGQPAPFRRFDGAPVVRLPLDTPAATTRGAPEPLSIASVSMLLRLSLGITAWKSQGPDRWAVRANPSSGNLHPVEAYLIVRDVAGLEAGVHHYRPEDHALELRARVDPASLPSRGWPALSVALTTVGWREAWKYGERGFRYCQLDVGHAMAALAHAAAALGWRAREQPQVGARTIARALGLDRAEDFPAGRWAAFEREEPEVVVAIEVDAIAPDALQTIDPRELEAAAASARWRGTASRIDPRPMYEWPVLAEVTRATRPEGDSPRADRGRSRHPRPSREGGASPGPPEIGLLLGRRSAQRFDDRHEMSRDDLFGLLGALTEDGPARALAGAFFAMEFLLFVQRVASVAPGVYVTSAREGVEPRLSTQLGDRLGPLLEDGPAGLEVRLLARVEPRPLGRLVRGLHCNQSIAAQACLALGMIASFDGPIAEDPTNYRRLHRQAGRLGQVLYLEAEKRGLRGTGIGCFFDDAVHDVLGLRNTGFQSLYHFVIGKAAPDPHVESSPAYPERGLPMLTEE